MATYRAWAPIESVMATSRMEALLRERSANVWLGPGRHMIVYPAEGGRILSINGTYPSRSIGVGEWSKSAGVEEVQQRFHDFDPLAKEILSKAQDCKSWALAELPRLSRWTSKSGKVVLIGDAAHGMLQFLAQGAALATEDAGAIAECMRSAVSTDDIPRMTRFYERSRKWRCEKVQANARRNGEFIHVPDGEVQERRDRKLTGAPFPDDENVDTGPLLDHEFMAWLYGHNTIAHVSVEIITHFQIYTDWILDVSSHRSRGQIAYMRYLGGLKDMLLSYNKCRVVPLVCDPGHRTIVQPFSSFFIGCADS